MKIAYISSPAFSDVDISFLSVASKIIDINYYLIIGPTNKKACAIDLSKDKLEEGITKASSITGMQRYSNIINLNNTYIVYFPSQKGYTVSSLKNSYRLYKHLMKNSYDILHLNYAIPYNLFILYFFRKKLIMTVHDPIHHSSNKKIMDELHRKIAFKLIKYFILLNKAQRDDFIKHYHIKEASIYTSQLSKYDYLNIYEENHFKTSKDYILYFGNIHSYKGLEYLFDAMEKMHVVYPNIKLIVAGRGNYYFDITRYSSLDYFDIRNRFIPDDELANLIKNCLFVVLPYVDATQSGVIMSAYAFNKPCIATNVGGLPEMLGYGKYGMIVEPKNSETLADAMCSMCNDELLRMYENNIKTDYLSGEKSWEFIASQYYCIYKEIAIQ